MVFRILSCNCRWCFNDTSFTTLVWCVSRRETRKKDAKKRGKKEREKIFQEVSERWWNEVSTVRGKERRRKKRKRKKSLVQKTADWTNTHYTFSLFIYLPIHFWNEGSIHSFVHLMSISWNSLLHLLWNIIMICMKRLLERKEEREKVKS